MTDVSSPGTVLFGLLQLDNMTPTFNQGYQQSSNAFLRTSGARSLNVRLSDYLIIYCALRAMEFCRNLLSSVSEILVNDCYWLVKAYGQNVCIPLVRYREGHRLTQRRQTRTSGKDTGVLFSDGTRNACVSFQRRNYLTSSAESTVRATSCQTQSLLSVRVALLMAATGALLEVR